MSGAPAGGDLGALLAAIRRGLAEAGLTATAAGASALCCGGEGTPAVKVVCVAPGLRQSVDELSGMTRDQVVMVRVDEDTSRALDAWVQTGAVRSRSEAAALFIREGLKVRADELEDLREALEDVERARQRLQERARDVFGDRPPAAGDH